MSMIELPKLKRKFAVPTLNWELNAVVEIAADGECVCKSTKAVKKVLDKQLGNFGSYGRRVDLMFFGKNLELCNFEFKVGWKGTLCALYQHGNILVSSELTEIEVPRIPDKLKESLEPKDGGMRHIIEIALRTSEGYDKLKKLQGLKPLSSDSDPKVVRDITPIPDEKAKRCLQEITLSPTKSKKRRPSDE
ncbi:hypothetical protein BGX34_000158 [Mortierella sp. NVP85]|nr:hypothetical protein BGX34_000158 [Mortierella sp. NVP85]